jgi:phosphotriesterase-related protein
MDLGRDVELARRVVDATGIQLVMCTGIYGSRYTFLPQCFANRDADYLADVFVHDIEVGMQGTDVKAAFLKCAVDEPGITDDVDKILRACARASKRTGRPIMSHSHPASGTGLKQMDVFDDEGVDPAKVVIAHTGDTDDLDYIERLLDRGVLIGMDRYGLEMFLPMAQRNATVAELLRRGYAGQMVLSQDYCATIDWFPPEAEEAFYGQGLVREDWGMTLVFDEVLPALRGEGVFTDEHFQTIFVENPRRWLAG